MPVKIHFLHWKTQKFLFSLHCLESFFTTFVHLYFPHIFTNQTVAVFLAEPVADTIAGVTTLTLFFQSISMFLNEQEEKVIDNQ